MILSGTHEQIDAIAKDSQDFGRFGPCRTSSLGPKWRMNLSECAEVERARRTLRLVMKDQTHLSWHMKRLEGKSEALEIRDPARILIHDHS